MHDIVPVGLLVLISTTLIVIGLFYVFAPTRVMGSFGLRPPTAPDADTLAWLHVKGIRDVASGLAVVISLLTTDRRSVAIFFLVLALIPFGDMANVLVCKGRRATAFSVHGLTCALMILASLLLLRIL